MHDAVHRVKSSQFLGIRTDEMLLKCDHNYVWTNVRARPRQINEIVQSPFELQQICFALHTYCVHCLRILLPSSLLAIHSDDTIWLLLWIFAKEVVQSLDNM